VIAEVVYVLSSKVLFAFSRDGIRARLVPLIMTPGLKVDDKEHYIRVLQLFAETNLHFVDCLLVAHAEAEDEAVIVSFDRGLDRVESIRREGP
jgi:predicted nucleic-acid-binding protein